MGLLDFTKTISETSERHNDRELLTRYYKTSYTKVKEQIEVFCNKTGMTIDNIDDNHGEIFIKTKKLHIIISVIQVSPIETAVDIKVQTYGLIGLNLPKKTVLAIYNHLNNTLSFKGVSLHP